MRARLGGARRPTRAPIQRSPDAGPRRPAARRELPEELLRRLEVKVLRRLDGFLFGDLSGLFYGPSLDLAEVREYQPGDEVRRIDWNVTARTGALHVRQYREEREIVAWLVVDRSESMSFGTRRVGKSDLALEFAGVIAAVVARAGKVGALSFAGDAFRSTPLGGGRRQALTVLDHLMAPFGAEGSRVSGGRRRGGDRTDAGGPRTARQRPTSGGLAGALERLQRTLRRRALVFVVSDYLDDAADPDGPPGHAALEPAWRRGLGLLARRHDVVAVRVVDPAERSLPAVGELRVRDLETGDEVWLDTADPRVRAEHARLVDLRETALERAFRASVVDVLEIGTERDLLPPLLRFSARRRGRRP